MEAANRGASEAGGETVGLGISIPFEQSSNPYISHKLNFEFHYFFIRKFWFVYLAKAFVVFPGGFGTMDELFEILTLVQTQKVTKHLPIVLYGIRVLERSDQHRRHGPLRDHQPRRPGSDQGARHA